MPSRCSRALFWGTPVAEAGAYRLVRHPMNAGLVAQAAAVGYRRLTVGAGFRPRWRSCSTARPPARRRCSVRRTREFAGYRSRTRWRFVPGLR